MLLNNRQEDLRNAQRLLDNPYTNWKVRVQQENIVKYYRNNR